MARKQIKLKFITVPDLWSFAQRIGATYIEINTKEVTLVCDCNANDQALAIEEYFATVVETAVMTN